MSAEIASPSISTPGFASEASITSASWRQPSGGLHPSGASAVFTTIWCSFGSAPQIAWMAST